ncbi:MAG: NUDIX hydrolase [Zoogloeaceae bacterium]|jgi:ADP-ribose pyrophosphatase YjhB (NUDIX family)|nr:NUDIX hydrolase [Zoogloeaceae bacterium]
MNERAWKPNVTVAALVLRDGRFLLVEEETEAGIRINQPAGHLEHGETLLEAVVRECREETGYDFHPQSLVGIYLRPGAQGRMTYLRFAFAGEVVGYDPESPLDTGIIAARWMTPEALRAAQEKLRSPMVQECALDYLAGRRLPLRILR